MESKGEIVIYRSPEGETELDVNLKDDTVWLTQNQMAKLFDKGKSIAKGWVFERLPDFNSYQHEKYRIVLLPEKKG